MKQQKVNRTNLCREIGEAQHDINKLLDYLRAGQSLKLPIHLGMEPGKDNRNNPEERKLTVGQINQMWRYGGCLTTECMNDTDLEQKLCKIAEWIAIELEKL